MVGLAVVAAPGWAQAPTGAAGATGGASRAASTTSVLVPNLAPVPSPTIPVAAPGAVPPSAQPLTVTPVQAADLAVQASLEVQAAQTGVTQAQALIKQAHAEGGLNLDLSAEYGRTGPVSYLDLSLFGQKGVVAVSSPEIESVTASATQPVYSGGRIEIALRGARHLVTAAQQSVVAAGHGVHQAALEAAYEVLRAQELAGVAHEQTTDTQAHLRIAQAMYHAGTVANFEVIEAQTQLEQAQGNEIAADTAVDQALALVRQVLVADQTRPVKVVPETTPVTRPPGDLPALINVAWAHRPELAALQAQVQAQEEAVRLARAAMNLSIDLTGSYTRLQPSLFSPDRNWQVALSATKPILDGGLTASQVMSAQATLKADQIAAEVEKQQVALDVTQPYLALDQAMKQLQVATQGVVDARERARVAEVRFGAGVTNGLEVLDADASVAAAEGAQVNANYDVQLAITRIYQAMGQPVTGGGKP
jgi:outer membrane protein TolC